MKGVKFQLDKLNEQIKQQLLKQKPNIYDNDQNNSRQSYDIRFYLLSSQSLHLAGLLIGLCQVQHPTRVAFEKLIELMKKASKQRPQQKDDSDDDQVYNYLHNSKEQNAEDIQMRNFLNTRKPLSLFSEVNEQRERGQLHKYLAKVQGKQKDNSDFMNSMQKIKSKNSQAKTKQITNSVAQTQTQISWPNGKNMEIIKGSQIQNSSHIYQKQKQCAKCKEKQQKKLKQKRTSQISNISQSQEEEKNGLNFCQIGNKKKEKKSLAKNNKRDSKKGKEISNNQIQIEKQKQINTESKDGEKKQKKQNNPAPSMKVKRNSKGKIENIKKNVYKRQQGTISKTKTQHKKKKKMNQNRTNTQISQEQSQLDLSEQSAHNNTYNTQFYGKSSEIKSKQFQKVKANGSQSTHKSKSNTNHSTQKKRNTHDNIKQIRSNQINQQYEEEFEIEEYGANKQQNNNYDDELQRIIHKKQVAAHENKLMKGDEPGLTVILEDQKQKYEENNQKYEQSAQKVQNSILQDKGDKLSNKPILPEIKKPLNGISSRSRYDRHYQKYSLNNSINPDEDFIKHVNKNIQNENSQYFNSAQDNNKQKLQRKIPRRIQGMSDHVSDKSSIKIFEKGGISSFYRSSINGSKEMVFPHQNLQKEIQKMLSDPSVTPQQLAQKQEELFEILKELQKFEKEDKQNNKSILTKTYMKFGRDNISNQAQNKVKMMKHFIKLAEKVHKKGCSDNKCVHLDRFFGFLQRDMKKKKIGIRLPTYTIGNHNL